MNRRRLIAMLPVAPLMATSVAEPASATEVVDTRPMFKRSEYVVALHGGSGDCLVCGGYHGEYFTQSCNRHHPVAFPKDWMDGWETEPAPVGAIPVGIISPCPLDEHQVGPHFHAEKAFRWV